MLGTLNQINLTNRRVIENDSFVKAIEYNGQDSLSAIVALKLQVLDAESLSLKKELTATAPTVDNAITGIRYVSRNTLISSASDGYVRVWDDRGQNPVMVLASTIRPEANEELKPLLCCDVSLDECTVAAGSEAVKDDAFVLFWDIRNSKQLVGGYWDSHSKDISQVRFHAENKSILATGGVDGLVNVFDLQETSEDDAIQYTLNIECAVNHLSWLPPSAKNVDRLGVVTTEDEFQLWEAEEAEPTARQNRENLKKDGVEVAIDHIVSAHNFGSEALFVTSANNGSVDLWTAQGAHVASLGRETEKKSSRHRDLVKCAVMHVLGDSCTLWTSGDDGIVCRWVAHSKRDVPMRIDERKAESEQKLRMKEKRPKPY